MKNMKEKLSAKLKKKNGFTLIEMLVVVAIIVILVLVSIPMVNSSLNKAKKATDEANERAAKAVATIMLLTDEDKVKTTMYYDAKDGTLKESINGIEKYGQSTQADYNNDGKIIKVTIDKTNDTVEVAWN